MSGVGGAVLRTRTAPEIVDAGVQLARRHFWELAAVAVIPMLPSFAFDMWSASGSPVSWPLLVGIAVGIAVSAAATDAAVAVAARDAFEGRTPDLAAALAVTGRRLWPVVATNFFRALLSGVGLVLLVAPGLMVLSAYALVPAIVVLEPRLGVRAALDRSRELTRDRRWCAFCCQGLPFLFVIAMGFAVDGIGESIGGTLLGGLLASIVQLVMTPFVVAIQVVLYFDLRMRREAYDIEAMIAAAPAA